MSPEDYVRIVLHERIGAKKLIIGYDHRFGKDRAGGLPELQQFGPKYGFEVEEIPRQDIDFSRLLKNRGHSTHCPIKGEASYYSLKTDEGLVENIAWSYQAPLDHAALIKGFLAFDAKAVKITRKP